jgi:hypothetical protein
MKVFSFFFPNFVIGNHPQGGLATFGYRSATKGEIY